LGKVRCSIIWLCILCSLVLLPGLYAMAQPEPITSQLANLLTTGKLAEADLISKRYLSERPASSETFLEIGRVYFEHNQWERAANLLRESIKLKNQNDVAHLLLGLSLGELKQAEESEQELLVAVQQNPRSELNWYFAGWRLLQRSKYEASLPYFYKALELNSKRDRRPSSLILTFLIYCSWATSKSLQARHWIMPVRLLLSIHNRLMHTTCAERCYSNSNGTRRLAMSSSAPPSLSLKMHGLTFCLRRFMTVWAKLSRLGLRARLLPG